MLYAVYIPIADGLTGCGGKMLVEKFMGMSAQKITQQGAMKMLQDMFLPTANFIEKCQNIDGLKHFINLKETQVRSFHSSNTKKIVTPSRNQLQHMTNRTAQSSEAKPEASLSPSSTIVHDYINTYADVIIRSSKASDMLKAGGL